MLTEIQDPRARDSKIIIGLLTFICIIGAGFVLAVTRSIVIPLALAVFLNFIINPLIQTFERLRIPSFISILLAILVTFLFFFVVGMMISSSIESFAEELPLYQTKFHVIMQNLFRMLNISPETFKFTWPSDPKIMAFFGNLSITEIITSILGSVSAILSNFLLVFLFLLFILIGRNQFIKKVNLAFTPETAEKMSAIIQNINQQIQKYLLAKTLISLLTALLAMLALYIFDIQFVFIWGILTFLLNFIPNIGSIIATILPLSVAIIQFDSFIMVVWLALCLTSIQMVVGNILDPKIIGDSINLSPNVVLFALVFWAWLWGIVGMFLAVPIAVIIKIVFENINQLRFISVLMSGKRV